MQILDRRCEVALNILQLLIEKSPGRLRAWEIADQIGDSESYVRGVLLDLQNMGYVGRAKLSHGYRARPMCVSVGTFLKEFGEWKTQNAALPATHLSEQLRTLVFHTVSGVTLATPEVANEKR